MWLAAILILSVRIKKKFQFPFFQVTFFIPFFFSLIFPFEQKCSAITFVLHIGCDIWKFIRRVNWTMAWIFYFNDALNIQQCSLHIAHSTVQCSAVQCNCILSNAPILYIFLVCSGVCVCAYVWSIAMCAAKERIGWERADRLLCPFLVFKMAHFGELLLLQCTLVVINNRRYYSNAGSDEGGRVDTAGKKDNKHA